MVAYGSPNYANSDKYQENVVGQTIIMLDDFTEENGATKILPGSHKKGYMPDNSKNTINEIENSARTICGKKEALVSLWVALGILQVLTKLNFPDLH